MWSSQSSCVKSGHLTGHAGILPRRPRFSRRTGIGRGPVLYLRPFLRTGKPRERSTMSWIYLVLAGLLEVTWAAGLKYTEGFTKTIPTAFTLLAMLLSVGMLGLALRHLPLGTAYAVWTGIGTIGTAIF